MSKNENNNELGLCAFLSIGYLVFLGLAVIYKLLIFPDLSWWFVPLMPLLGLLIVVIAVISLSPLR